VDDPTLFVCCFVEASVEVLDAIVEKSCVEKIGGGKYIFECGTENAMIVLLKRKLHHGAIAIELVLMVFIVVALECVCVLRRWRVEGEE
jgi:hypothetical protein